ncbi:MAG TPA: sulfotransferase, partial [Nevskiaceae bacterium]|nr:sulfotransferase [Nevskiaceae bacterium]
LIVAGTYRSGTTSLYTYLSGHPQVQPSSIKEPAFFFSERWAETPPVYPPGHEVEAYLSLFKRKPQGNTWLEATPNYLHDPGCAERIRAALPQAKIVVVLRDPVSRLVSWYKHSLFQGRLGASSNFAEWIGGQLADPRPEETRPYMQRAVVHGRYSRYLEEYYRVFGRANVRVVWFDDLEANPRQVMQDICGFAGIDPAYFDDYRFKAQNQSMQFNRRWLYNAYMRVCRLLVAASAPLPRLQFQVKKVVYSIAPAFLRWVTRPADEVDMPEATRLALVEYYRQDIEPLRQVLGTKIPWAGAYQPR